MTLQFKPRVRETSTTTGTSTFALLGPMRGSMAFSDAGAVGDTFDYVASFDDTFEEGTGTLGGSVGAYTLTRNTVSFARHSNGVVDQTLVAFAAGVKTIIGSFRSDRASKTVRYGEVQTLSSGEMAQARANAPPFAAGTLMLFQQTSSPVGWTKQTTHDDKSLRVVSGTASSGGTSPFSTVFGKTATDAHTLITSELPAHSHTITDVQHSHGVPPLSVGTFGGYLGGGGLGAVTNVTYAGGSTGATSSVFTGITGTNNAGSGGSHTHPMDIRVQYVDLIIASKD